MGKLSDALERNKKEKEIKTQPLYPRKEKVPAGERNTPASDPVKGYSNRNKLVVLSEPESMDAENFKILRSHVLFLRDQESPRIILVTSTFPGEGKTFVAANLAVSIALSIDQYVLLIDCDLRRPNLHKMLGYSNAEGLHEFLVGKRQLPELIVRTEIDKLSVLLAGDAPRNPTELLSSKRMEEFLQEVKGRYHDRFIVIDATPAQVTAEVNVLAKYVDAIILVVMAEKTPREAVHKTIRNLGKDKILGIVFNGFSQANRSYDKYYRKYYQAKG